MNICVTGGIGSGKSMVTRVFAEMIGALPVSADSICRDLLEVGSPGWHAMQKEFPADFFLPDTSVNRPHLRQAIFSDPILRENLDTILHPLVRQELFRLFDLAEKEERDLVAEVPLLFEKGWQDDFTLTVVVFAEEDSCVERIVGRDKVPEEEARLSLAAQMDLNEKCRLADFVINNSGTISATHAQIRHLCEELPENSCYKRKRNDN